jgi:hypothetical protein
MIFEKLIHHLPQQPLMIHCLYPVSTSESEYLLIFSIVLIFPIFKKNYFQHFWHLAQTYKFPQLEHSIGA